MTMACVTGAPADPDGVCTEHGEHACVLDWTGDRLPSGPDDPVSCGVCGAMVLARNAVMHHDWHATIPAPPQRPR